MKNSQKKLESTSVLNHNVNKMGVYLCNAAKELLVRKCRALNDYTKKKKNLKSLLLYDSIYMTL